MKYIKGHLKKNLNSWINKKWYHQRFDGCPYFMHFISEGEIRKEKRKLDCNFAVHYSFYTNGRTDWYILMDDINRITLNIIDISRKNSNLSSNLINSWADDSKKFYKKCVEVKNQDLSELTNKQLMELHNDFSEIVINKNSGSSIIDGFALGTDELIADKIKKIYDESTIKNKLRFTELFSNLTAPVHLSFINEAEIELLKLAEKFEKDNLKHIFMKNITSIKKEIKKLSIYNLLINHQKNYFWIQNNYIDNKILTVDYFIQELKKIFELKLEIEAEINSIRSTPENSRKRKQELVNELNIDSELRNLIKISEDFTYWQDERKKSTFWTTHYFSPILEEIAKRIGISLECLKYMTCREISLIFKNKPDIKELKKRKNNCVYYWDREGMEALHSKQANEIKEAILGKTDFLDVDDFRGLTACLGKAVGKVKIIRSATEIQKVEKGDILVAVMTRPDYVPGMKKAAAIVTDEGGITCHAAIVSRELGIPCIIGTKIATQVLKDGQIVQVNANHGWVKIIK